MRLRRASRSARVGAAGYGGCRQGQDEALAAGEEGVEGAEVPGHGFAVEATALPASVAVDAMVLG